MSIHVTKCNHKGLVEFHLRYPGMSEKAAQNIADKINSGELDRKDPSSVTYIGVDTPEANYNLGDLGKIGAPTHGIEATVIGREDGVKRQYVAAKYEDGTISFAISTWWEGEANKPFTTHVSMRPDTYRNLLSMLKEFTDNLSYYELD